MRLPGPNPEGFHRPIDINTSERGGVRLSDAAAGYTAMPERAEMVHFQSGPGNHAQTIAAPPKGDDDPTE